MALVILVALSCRLCYLVALRVSPLFGFYVADQSYYRDWGLNIASSSWVNPDVFEQGPLYAYLLGLVYRLVGPRDMVVVACQLLAGVLTVLLVTLCARLLFSHRAAVISGLLAAVYGPLVFHEGLLMKTWLEPLLAMTALYAGLRYASVARPRWLLLSAASIGLLCLVREVHGLLLFAIGAWAWLVGGRRDLSPWRRIGHQAAALLAFLLVLLPSVLRNCLSAAECVPVTRLGGEVAYIAFGPYASAYYTPPLFVRPVSRIEHQDFQDEASLRSATRLSRSQTSDFWLQETRREALSAPARVIRLLALKVRALLNDYEFPDSENFAVTRRIIPFLTYLPTFGWIVGMGAAGIVCSLRGSKAPFLPLLFAAIFALEVVLTYAFGRFRLVLAPILLLFVGQGLDRVLQLASSSGARKGSRLIAIAFIAALATGIAYLPPPIRAGEEWIRRIDNDFRSEVAVRSQERTVIAELEKHLASHPDDAEAWGSLGDESEAIGKLFEARNSHLKALRFDPGRAASHWSLANLFYRQGRLALALDHARSYVRIAPGDSRGHTALAVFSSRLALESDNPGVAGGLRDEATTHFREAIDLSPADAVSYYYRGKFLALNGQWEEAAGDLDRALDIKPDSLESLHLMYLIRRRLAGGPTPG